MYTVTLISTDIQPSSKGLTLHKESWHVSFIKAAINLFTGRSLLRSSLAQEIKTHPLVLTTPLSVNRHLSSGLAAPYHHDTTLNPLLVTQASASLHINNRQLFRPAAVFPVFSNSFTRFLVLIKTMQNFHWHVWGVNKSAEQSNQHFLWQLPQQSFNTVLHFILCHKKEQSCDQRWPSQITHANNGRTTEGNFTIHAIPWNPLTFASLINWGKNSIIRRHMH